LPLGFAAAVIALVVVVVLVVVAVMDAVELVVAVVVVAVTLGSKSGRLSHKRAASGAAVRCQWPLSLWALGRLVGIAYCWEPFVAVVVVECWRLLTSDPH